MDKLRDPFVPEKSFCHHYEVKKRRSPTLHEQSRRGTSLAKYFFGRANNLGVILNYKTAIALICFVASSLAQATIVHNNFFYEGGYFHRARVEVGSAPRWSETINGVVSYYFIESDRTNNYAELFDSSRGMHVRLLNDHFELSAHGALFTYFKAGHFDDRMDLMFRNPDGAISRYSLEDGNNWTLNNGDGYTQTAFKEAYRGSDATSGIKIERPGETLWLMGDGGIYVPHGLHIQKVNAGLWDQLPKWATGGESRVLELINQERTSRGIPALILDQRLSDAATKHSQNEALKHTSDHFLFGVSPGTRIAREGYYARHWAEDIYYGSGDVSTPEAAVNWWMNSPPHREAILDPQNVNAGIGQCGGSDPYLYWVLDFGTPQ